MQKQKYYIVCKKNRCIMNIDGFCYKAHILITEDTKCLDYKEKIK